MFIAQLLITSMAILVESSKLCDYSKPDFKSILGMQVCNNNNYSYIDYDLWKLDVSEKGIAGKVYTKEHYNCLGEYSIWFNRYAYDPHFFIEKIDNDFDKLCAGLSNDPYFKMSDEWTEKEWNDNGFDQPYLGIKTFPFSKYGYKGRKELDYIDDDKPGCKASWGTNQYHNGHVCKEEDITIQVNYKGEMFCAGFDCSHCDLSSGRCLTPYHGLTWKPFKRNWTLYKAVRCIVINNQKLLCDGQVFNVDESKNEDLPLRGMLLDRSGYIALSRSANTRVKRSLINNDIRIDELNRKVEANAILSGVIWNATGQLCSGLNVLARSLKCDLFFDDIFLQDHHVRCENGVASIFPCIKVNIISVSKTTCVDKGCKLCFTDLPVYININRDKIMFYNYDTDSVKYTSSKEICPQKKAVAVDSKLYIYSFGYLTSTQEVDTPSHTNIFIEYKHPFSGFADSIYNVSELFVDDHMADIQNYNEKKIAELQDELSRIVKSVKSTSIPSPFDPNYIFSSISSKVFAYVLEVVNTVGKLGGVLFTFSICASIKRKILNRASNTISNHYSL